MLLEKYMKKLSNFIYCRTPPRRKQLVNLKIKYQLASECPNNIALNLKNCSPCKGFVKISAHIFSVSQCRNSKVPSSKYCLTKKCLKAICLFCHC